MTSDIWNWACAQVLRVCTFLFGSAISFLGVATVSLLVLLWIYTIIRLIVRPIIGMAMGDVYSDLNKRMTKNKSWAVAREKAKRDVDKEGYKHY